MLAVVLLIPPADSTLQGGADQWFFHWDFHRFNQSLSRIWNSYILVLVPGDSKSLDVLFFSVLSLGILGFCLIFFWDYPVILAFYSCGTGSILLFTYLKFLGSARHYGNLYLILIAALWLKNHYSSSSLLSNWARGITKNRLFFLTIWQSWVKRHFLTFFIVLLYCQLVAGLVGYIRDLTLPYSASRATAHYLQRHQLDRLFLIGSEDFTMTPISGYLGRKIYYPESNKVGSFVIFNQQRHPVNDQEILQQVLSKLAESSPILLILNHPLETSFPTLNIQPLEKFTNSFIGNEQYYLYLIR
jgi:hypothetical protein